MQLDGADGDSGDSDSNLTIGSEQEPLQKEAIGDSVRRVWKVNAIICGLMFYNTSNSSRRKRLSAV